MARICSLPCTIFQYGSIKKPISRVFMPRQSQIPASKPPSLQIRSSTYNKVFEDQSRGIICYTDDCGEIICEGYDEGPRFHQQAPNTTSHHLRNLGILHLLEQNWSQIVEGNGFHHAEKGVAAQEEFDWTTLRDSAN